MSVHWAEALTTFQVKSPERLLEAALAAHGWSVTSRKELPAGGAEPAVPGTLRWRQKRLPDGTPLLWVSDIDRELGEGWWLTLSALLDGFVLGFEKSDYRGLHRIVLGLEGVALENRLLPPDGPDARALWDERFEQLFTAHPDSRDQAPVLHAEDWWLSPAPPTAPPRGCEGGRALLSNVDESRFRALAVDGLGGWRYRPWVSTIGEPAIDLWRPAGFEPDRIRHWAAAADCLAVTWTVEGEQWRWEEWIGSTLERQGETREPRLFIQALRTPTTSMGEVAAAIGGRGLDGWRDT